MLTKGVPLKIRGTAGPRATQASVDSELALLYRELIQGPVPPEGPMPNPYFRPSATAPFSRADHDIYLVTRLDGYTWEDVRGLIDHATAPVRHGKVVLDTKAANFLATWRPGNSWLRQARRALEGLRAGGRAGPVIARRDGRD